MDLTTEEINALNDWLVVQCKERAGPSQEVPYGFEAQYDTKDVVAALRAVNDELAESYISARSPLYTNSSSETWATMGESNPSAIMIAMKAGASNYLSGGDS